MRMNDPCSWQAPDAIHAFSNMLAKGEAIELTHVAPKWLSGGPVAIESGTFDRVVAWDSEAQRRFGVHLDEANRLAHLFDACGTAACGAGGCFICKAVDARGYDARWERHVLTMTNYGAATEPAWLIHF